MKIKILLFAFLSFNLFCLGQEKVDIAVSYKLNYKLDSTSQNTKGENFLLYANKDKSMFLSTVTYVKDSLLSQPNSNVREILLKYRTPNSYYIITEPQTNTVSQYQGQSISETKVYYSTADKIQWKLENETKEIMNLKCRKATTELFGRKWIAWYSEEYPFQFGPYKFNGLPGLIVEIYDTKDDYHFLADLIKKKKNKSINFNIRKEYKEIPKDKFWTLDTKSKYVVDPVFDEITNLNGESVAPTMRKNMLEKQKRENNPLELKH
jgi:GLPGLI family protein